MRFGFGFGFPYRRGAALPALSVPTLAVTFSPTITAIDVTDIDANADDIQIQRATVANFSDAVNLTDTYTTGATYNHGADADADDQTAQYHYRVRAIGDGINYANSPWSDVESGYIDLVAFQFTPLITTVQPGGEEVFFSLDAIATEQTGIIYTLRNSVTEALIDTFIWNGAQSRYEVSPTISATVTTKVRATRTGDSATKDSTDTHEILAAANGTAVLTAPAEAAQLVYGAPWSLEVDLTDGANNAFSGFVVEYNAGAGFVEIASDGDFTDNGGGNYTYAGGTIPFGVTAVRLVATQDVGEDRIDTNAVTIADVSSFSFTASAPGRGSSQLALTAGVGETVTYTAADADPAIRAEYWIVDDQEGAYGPDDVEYWQTPIGSSIDDENDYPFDEVLAAASVVDVRGKAVRDQDGGEAYSSNVVTIAAVYTSLLVSPNPYLQAILVR